MIKFNFSKKLKLLNSKQFLFVFQQSNRINLKNIIIFSRLNFLNYPRIGLIITKKRIKRAHERNRIKRVIRESFRMHQYVLPSMDFIVITKKEVININNCTLIKNLKKLWSYYCH